MGTTGTASVKLLLCGLLLMNEQREGEEGLYPSGCSKEWESHQLELLPAEAGRHCQADCHQPSCLPSDACGLVTLVLL